MPGWLRKMSVRYLENIPEGNAQHIASSSQVRLLVFAWQNCFKPAGEGNTRVYLVP